MKLLFDQNLSRKLVGLLADTYPESSHVGLLGLDTSNDRVIWNFAKEQGFVIVSLDADFAEMAALYGNPPQVIWLRCGNQPTRKIHDLIRAHREQIAMFGADSAAACLELY